MKRYGGIVKCLLLGETSQPEKTIYCTIPTTWHSGKGKMLESIKRSIVARGWEERWMNRQSTEDF